MNAIKKYQDPKNNIAFKRLLGTGKNKATLIAMPNALLKPQLHKMLKPILPLYTPYDDDDMMIMIG